MTLHTQPLNTLDDTIEAIRDIQRELKSSGWIKGKQIAPQTITNTQLDSSVTTGVPHGASLPSLPGYSSELFYLETDGKLYRQTPDGLAWTVAVPTVDLTGQIANAQIVDGAINDVKIAIAAINNAHLQDNIISTGKLQALAVTTGTIAANAITTGKIAALAVTTSELAAGSVSTAKLQANSVTSNEIAANSIIAGKIAAAIITSTEIAAATITGSNIAASTITASNIAALTITAAQIAAGTITGAKISAATITGSLIAANTITAANIVAATITAAEIAGHTITAGQIAAGTITATEIAANTITATQITAATITATELAANSITTTQLSAGSVTAAKISVTTLSSITADVGTLTAGIIQNAGATRGILLSGSLPGGWTTYLNLLATGTNPILHHPGLDLNADGSANFAGSLSAATFTAATITFNNTNAIINFPAASAGLGQTPGIQWQDLGLGHTTSMLSDGSSIFLQPTGGVFIGPIGANFRVATVISSSAAPSGSAIEGTLWLKTTATKSIHVYTAGAWTQIV